MAKQDKSAERGQVTETANTDPQQPTNPDGTPTDRRDGATVKPSADSVGQPTTGTSNA